MLLHRFDAEPRLYVSSVTGMRLDATSAVTVSVSEEALPSVVLPRTERLPERLLVPEVFVELKRPVICTSPSASMRNSSEPFTATPRRTLLVVSSVPKSPSVAKMFVEVAVPKYPMPLTVSAVVEAYEVVRRESALSKVNADELASCPELVAKTTRPPARPDTYWSVVDAVLAYRFVEVNAVDDAYGNVLLPVAVDVMAPAILRAPPKVLVPVVVNAPATVVAKRWVEVAVVEYRFVAVGAVVEA